jgi:Zn-dependent alcohol dehydrogenase
MKTTAALMWELPGTWQVGEVELDPPKEGEVLVRLAATGLCHSDDHYAKGDIGFGTLPFVGGHEGAGTVEAVGPGVAGLKPAYDDMHAGLNLRGVVLFDAP